MLGAFCSIRGGQRDFFWFPKFDKKNLFLIPLNLLRGSLTCRIQYNFSLIELISKLSPHSCRRGKFPFALIAAHSHFEPKVLTYKNRKQKILVYDSPLKQWKALLVRNKDINKPKTKPRRSRGEPWPELHLPQWRLVLIPSLNSFQSKRCTKIWHDKRRENETIPIWNLIVALAENSVSQWSRFSWTPSVRS